MLDILAIVQYRGVTLWPSEVGCKFVRQVSLEQGLTLVLVYTNRQEELSHPLLFCQLPVDRRTCFGRLSGQVEGTALAPETVFPRVTVNQQRQLAMAI